MPRTKNSRRTLAIVSTPFIPHPPIQIKGRAGLLELTKGGQFWMPIPPLRGVNIPRRSTLGQRYERGATVVTSNLPFDEWTATFGEERLTGALLDRLTHHVHILEMNWLYFSPMTIPDIPGVALRVGI